MTNNPSVTVGHGDQVFVMERDAIRNKQTGEAWSDLTTWGANQTGDLVRCHSHGYGRRIVAGDVITIPGVFLPDRETLTRFTVQRVMALDDRRIGLTIEPPIVKGQTVSTLPANGAWISVWEQLNTP